MKKWLSMVIVLSLMVSGLLLTACSAGEEAEPERFSEESYIIASQEADAASQPYTIDRNTREQEISMGEDGTWTVFYYMCGSDLESNSGLASGVLIDLMSSPPADHVNIVVQTGGAKSWGASKNPNIFDKDLVARSGTDSIGASKLQRYELSDTLTLVDEQDRASMGDPNTLYEFLSWGVENYPADNMAVVLYNHGGGSLSGVCFDELYENDSLTPSELTEAFSTLYPEMTERFEYVTYSTCLSSTVEMANALVSHSRYLIASQEVSVDTDESIVTRTLNEHPEYSGAEVGQKYCDNYQNFFFSQDNPSLVAMAEAATFAVIDLEGIDDVLYALNDLSTAFNENREDQAYLNDVTSALYYSDSFLYPDMVDLGDFATRCMELQPVEATALKTAVDNAVIYQIKGSNHDSVSGLSFYYPITISNKSVTRFAQCPTSAEYKKFAAYVQKSFIEQSNSDEPLVKSISEPTVNDDNSVSLQLDEGDIDKVVDVGYETYIIQEGTDELRYLGYDTEIAYDDETASLYALFDGRWPTLEGELLMISLISETEEEVVYKAPVLLNDKQTNIVIRWVWQAEGEHTGYYEIVGTWSGVDEESGLATRDISPLETGDTITPLYASVDKDDLFEQGSIHRVQDAHDELGSLILTEGSKVTIGNEVSIKQQKLPEGEYYYQFSVVNTLMGKSGFTPMKCHISPDGILVWDRDAS